MVRRPLILVASALLLAACGSSSESPGPGTPAAGPCGWDLTSQAGRDANAERLTFVDQWLTDNPGQTPPAPTSTYWLGECPTPSGPPPGPPVDEAHDDAG